MRKTVTAVWAFDFDGTLSDIVPDRDSAVLDPACAKLLAELASDRRQIVAVISSRTLDDLASRVRVDRVVLSGGSGLEWRLPDNERIGPNRRAEERLGAERQRLLPALETVRRVPGVVIEDKTWSVAVHFREVADEDRILVAREIENLHIRHGVSRFYGPEVAEIQFLQEVSKEFAVKTLITLFDPRTTVSQLVYAGDDQNDARAMRWVMDRKGTAYVVGDRISIPGAEAVPDPSSLVRAIRRRFGFKNARAAQQAEGAVNE